MIQYSALMTELMAQVKALDCPGSIQFTAERFVLVLMDKVEQEPKKDGELAAAEKILRSFFSDWELARSLLTHYVQNRRSDLMDDLYIKNTMQGAMLTAQNLPDPHIGADTLMACILENPSVALARIAGGHNPTEEERKKVEQSVSFRDLLQRSLRTDGDSDDEAEEEEQPATSTVPTAKDRLSELVGNMAQIREKLQSTVYGQDNAINTFITGYFQACVRSMTDPTSPRPRATFLFAGPPGVGKTFLSETIAKTLGLPFARFDMSEYADKEANIEFCGSDKVYKNGKAGNVTSFVAEHPKCVLLFDEIEKAHICVIHLFLQMLDAGRLRDNFTDVEVSFKDTLIILTTNAGKQLYEDWEGGSLASISRKTVIRALQTDVDPNTNVPYFPGAICSRFASGNVVMFDHIDAHYLHMIAKKEIQRHATGLTAQTGMDFSIDEGVYTALMFAEGSKADARTIRSRAESFFDDELYELLRMISSQKVKSQISQIQKIRIEPDLEKASAEIRGLFNPAGSTQVLLLSDADTVAACRNIAPASVDITGVQTAEAAIRTLKEQDIRFVLLDMRYGASAVTLDSLNMEDMDSPARDFFHFVSEQGKHVPVYLLEKSGALLSQEELVSFQRMGIRGVVRLGRSKRSFTQRLDAIAHAICQQGSMTKLARENKLVSFETAQAVSKDGKTAKIRLFDWKMHTAVDAEDSKNVLSAVSKPNVRFEQVIGAEDAKKELAYFVSYLKDPKKYMGTGVKAPRGVLLYGPPGTGKTMLAKAMACEADVTFIAAQGNQFLKPHMGTGEEEVHSLFRTARKYAPSILFIDEIDAIAKERRGVSSAEDVLTAFLTEMDGFDTDPSRPVFVLAATNFDVEPGSPKSLDPALMRRFDRRVYIDLPGKEDRIRFLNAKLASNTAFAVSAQLVENLALRSTGMSLAQLDSALELALRSAIREGSVKVTDSILEEAFETFNSGETKKWDASQLARVARHEAGHAFMCWYSGETPSYLTIVARGNHGGYMQHASQEGKAIYTKEELLARIRTSLGGRAAEIAYYGEKDGISTGASGDLANATALAERIVCSYGMDEDFGTAVISDMAANSALALQVREAVNRILSEQMAQALQIITSHKEQIDRLVDALMTKNHMTGPDIEAVLCIDAQRITNT